MAVSIRTIGATPQQGTAQSAAASTTLAISLPAAPTAGNLLVLAMAGDKNTGALTLAGFTQLHQLLSTSVSLYVYWKVSNGTETTINPSWATASQAGNMAWYAEYQDAAVAGSTWQVSAQASNITNEAATLSQATGTTGVVAAAGLGIAFAAIDSSQNVTTVGAWGNGYTARYSGTGGSGRAGPFVAEKQEAAGATTNSTFNYTGTSDQVSAAIAVFTKTASTTVITKSGGIAATASMGGTKTVTSTVPKSRLFDGADDWVDFAPPSVLQPKTILLALKTTSLTSGNDILSDKTGGQPELFVASNTFVLGVGGVSSFGPGGVWVANEWMLLAITHPQTGTVAPRFHGRQGGEYIHGNGATAVAPFSFSASGVRLGTYFDGTFDWAGQVAFMAFMSHELTDAEFIKIHRYDDVLQFNPESLIRFDHAPPFLDDVGAMDQTSISGTQVAADAPRRVFDALPNWNYASLPSKAVGINPHMGERFVDSDVGDLGVQKVRIEQWMSDTPATEDAPTIRAIYQAEGAQPLPLVNNYAIPWAPHQPWIDAALQAIADNPTAPLLEIANEPWGNWFWPQAQSDDAAGYAQMVAAVADAVTTATSGAVGVLAATEPGAWLEDMLEAVPDLLTKVAGVTAHPYGPLDSVTDLHVSYQGLFEIARQVDFKPVYVTEAGLDTHDGTSTEANQVTQAQRYSTDIQANAWLRQFHWFSHKDSAATGAGTGWGLLRTDASRKPAWTTWQSAAAAMASGVTKAGGLVGIASAGAAKAILVVKTGGPRGIAAAGATKTATLRKNGGVVGSAAVGASKALGLTKSGGTQGVAATGGVRSIAVGKGTGGPIGTAMVGGVRLVGLAKSGGIAAIGSPGGTRTTSQVTAKTGGVVAIGAPGGTKTTAQTKAGGIAATGAAGGQNAISASKAGGIIATGVPGGAKTALVGESKTGGPQATVVLGGTRVASVTKMGGTLGAATIGGGKALALGKGGGPSTSGLLGGGRSATAAKDGGLTAASALGAQRQAFVWKAGGVVAVGLLGGSRAASASRAGGPSARASLGGGRVASIFKAGGISATAAVGATNGLVLARTGGFSARLVLGGQRVTAIPGGLSSTASLGGTKTVVVSKTGGMRATATFNGFKPYTLVELHLPLTTEIEALSLRVTYEPNATEAGFEPPHQRADYEKVQTAAATNDPDTEAVPF